MLILLNINLLLTILSTIRPMFYIAKDIEYFSEGIQYSIFNIQHPISNIQYPTSSIQYPIFNIHRVLLFHAIINQIPRLTQPITFLRIVVVADEDSFCSNASGVEQVIPDTCIALFHQCLHLLL